MSSAGLWDTKSIYESQLYLYTLAMNDLKTKLKSNSIYNSIEDNKIFSNKFLKSEKN